jgi:predicted dienelactone hydrolase
MWMRRLFAAACAALLAGGAVAFDGGAYGEPGPFAVRTVLTTWRDGERGRDIPIKAYVPAVPGEVPVILFSHGLGGTREAGRLWAEHWASQGYLSIHLQHAGSDESLWRGAGSRLEAMRGMKSGMDPRQYVARVEDVRFVVAELGRRKSLGDPLARLADLGRIGMSGHSFGALTTQGVAGERNAAGPDASVQQIRAAIAFSPSAGSRLPASESRFAAIRMPFFSVTGTEDGDVMGTGSSPANRQLPFRLMPAPDKYLLVLRGADHMTFSGQTGRREPDAQQVRLVRAATLAFWDAYLKGDAAAKAWLAGGGFATLLGAGGTFAAK